MKLIGGPFDGEHTVSDPHLHMLYRWDVTGDTGKILVRGVYVSDGKSLRFDPVLTAKVGRK